MPLQPGTRLGPYEIVSPLGAGGMGEVYRARDTRLGRDVALKVLPADVAADAGRRQRFELEARAVAALSHPNIVALYDVGEGYLVSELVDGEPLRGAKFGLRKTLDIAVQLASGLAAAHTAGIIHRDLKPDNILLTRDGRVKILDFGLAKLRPVQASGATGAETQTVRTDPGVVMGTVGYMSPEQVRGLEVDHRSDIFSFGAVLHELLSGKRAFHGETSVDTMQAILRQEPAELSEAVPSALRQMVAHCLEKDPANRFQSARDLGFALSAMSPTGSHSVTAAAPALASRSPRLAVIALAALVLIAAGALAARQWWRQPAAPVWNGVLLGGPEVAMFPRPSPDGHLLAFAVADEQIAIMKPESGNWTILTHAAQTGFLSFLSWSPDGARIYYDRSTDVPRGIYSVPVLGGPEQLILEDAAGGEALADGSLLVVRYNAERLSQVFRFWPETGRFQAFPLRVGKFATAIRAFPGGREAIAIGTLIGPGQDAGRHLYVIDLQSGSVRRLLPSAQDDSAARAVGVTRDGDAVFVAFSAGNLIRVSKISRSGEILVPSLLTLTNTVYAVEEGTDGGIYVDQVERPESLVRFSEKDGRVEKIAALASFAPAFSADTDEIFAILPDGRAASTTETNGRTHLMMLEAGHDPVPFVNTTEETSAPAVAVGAGQIAFLIGPAPRRTIALAENANGRITRRIPFDKGTITALAASPDGTVLYCAAGGNVWSIPLSGGEPKKLRAGDHVAADPHGKYLLIDVVESPIIRLIRLPLDGGAEQEIHINGPLRPANLIGPNSIGKDGRVVMALGSPYWYWPAGVLDPATGLFTRIPTDRNLDYHVLGWTPDGKVMGLGLDVISKMWKFTHP